MMVLTCYVFLVCSKHKGMSKKTSEVNNYYGVPAFLSSSVIQ